MSKTLILPIHGLVMATNCKSLASLSTPLAIPSHVNVTTRKGWTNLPVVHLELPSAAAFSMLVPYFYTHSSASLLSSLLPLRHQPHLAQLSRSARSPDILLSDTPHVLSARLSVLDEGLLLEHLGLVHATWQTVVALGAARDGIWKTMQLAWDILVGAVAIKESRK